MYKYDFSLIIPAFNEENKIAKDISEAFKFFNKSKIKAEVIISTDGVTDKTNEIVKDLQKEFKDLKLIAVNKRVGKGAAIKKGVKIAKGQYIMFADSGLCVPFKYIKDGLKLLNSGFDLALASRAQKTSQIIQSQPTHRVIGAKVFKYLIKSFYGIPENINDTQCGFKLFKAKVAKDLFSSLKTKKMMFDLEIILRAKAKRYKMAEFPVEWKNDPDTKLHLFFGTLNIIEELILIKKWIRQR